MIPELGHYALALACVVALVQASLPLLGAAREYAPLRALARPAAQMQALLLLLASASLVYAFVVGDFSVAYVAAHANSRLPLLYRVAALWGGHEGSLLLWALLLSGCGALAASRSRSLEYEYGPAFAIRLVAVLGWLGAGFLIFILFSSNPFLRLDPAPLDGRSLNPLLQDVRLTLHPPLLYLGYVGLAVVYAATLAGLLGGRVDAPLLRWLRAWVLGAWMCLTLGIVLGSWWAYYELGWGGWWSWDPVENAALMPWLLATAVLHVLPAAQRGALRAWTVLLIVAAFTLSLFGTFLVRSGVVGSVHAFASDPARGAFILLLLALALAAALMLFSWRRTVLRSPPLDALGTRELLAFAATLLFTLAATIVLLGTVYPLTVKSLGLTTVTVNAAFYEAVLLPVLVPLLLLLGAGPLLADDTLTLRVLWRRLRLPLIAALLALLGAVGMWREALDAVALCVVGLVGWIGGAWITALRQTPARAGMLLAHAGVAVFVTGMTLSGTLVSEQTLRLAPGATADMGGNVAGYRLRLLGEQDYPGPNYWATRVHVQVTRGGDTLDLYPEKRRYSAAAAPTSEVAVDTDWRRDVYLALGERQSDGSWTLRVQIKPFMRWLWLGAVLMVLGAGAALTERVWQRRRAIATQLHSAPEASA